MRRWLPAIGAALALGVVATLLYHANGGWMYDAKVYAKGGAGVLAGRDLYAPGPMPFTYPPFAGVLFVPLALAGALNAAALWTALSLLGLEVTLWCCLGWSGVTGERRRIAATAGLLVLVVWLDPVSVTLLLGQVNLILLGVVLADLSLSDRSRWKGLGVGLAAGIKLVPAFFILYLLLTRRLRAAALSTAALAATVAVGFAVAPVSSARYWGGLFLAGNRVGDAQNVNSQSLQSLLTRWLHTSQGTRPLWALSILAVSGLALFAALRAHRRGDELLALCACGTATLLITPITWQHHWVWMVPILIWLSARAWRDRSTLLATVALVVAVDFYARPYQWVPVNRVADLHLDGRQLLLSSTYALAGLGLLGLFTWMTRSAVAQAPPDLDASAVHRSLSE